MREWGFPVFRDFSFSVKEKRRWTFILFPFLVEFLKTDQERENQRRNIEKRANGLFGDRRASSPAEGKNASGV